MNIHVTDYLFVSQYSEAHLCFLQYYERDFMGSLNHGNQADVIEAFNSTFRYLDDLLNIDNLYFEGMVKQIYPPELQLNNANNTFKHI